MDMSQRAIQVVIADDNEDFALTTKAMLESQGIEVVAVATTGEDAIAQTRRHKPDVLVLDLCLPRTDGLGVLSALSSRDADNKTSVLVYSCIGNEEITRQAMAAGAAYYLFKDNDISILVDRIRALACGDFQRTGAAPAGEPQLSTQLQLERAITDIIHDIGVPAKLLEDAARLGLLNHRSQPHLLIALHRNGHHHAAKGQCYNIKAHRLPQHLTLFNALDDTGAVHGIQHLVSNRKHKIPPRLTAFPAKRQVSS